MITDSSEQPSRADNSIAIVISTHTQAYNPGRHVVRLERTSLATRPDKDNCQHVVDCGLYSGVIVAKPGVIGSKVKKAHVTTYYVTHLSRYSKKGRIASKERRGVSFWMMHSDMEKDEKINLCSEFMHCLLEPETYPQDHVGYIKKCLWLLQLFEEMRRIELSFEGVPEDVSPVKEEVPLIANYITVLTPALYDYQYLPEVPASRRSKVKFKVKSGGGACIALGHVYGDTDRQTYEVVLGEGGSSRNLIRYGGRGQIVAESRASNLLNKNEFRDFWIDWMGGSVRVGKGENYGENEFLRWENIPAMRRHLVNLISVSGSVVSGAQWEFIEYIKPYTVQCESKCTRRKRVRKAVVWYSKQKKMVQQLEEAFPSPLDTGSLLKQCALGFGIMLESVMFLKSIVERQLVSELRKGIWLRLHTYPNEQSHELKMVKSLPSFEQNPSVAVVTSLYCEKMAVDHMFDSPPTSYFIENDGDGLLYSVGKMASRIVMVTKLPNFSPQDGCTENHTQYIIKLLDLFPKLRHIFVLGVGGGVPNYANFDSHVRRGDVVVSYPRSRDGATYIHCPDLDEDRDDLCATFYATCAFNDADAEVVSRVDGVVKMRSDRAGKGLPWERFAEQALSTLGVKDERFFKPPSKSDILTRVTNAGKLEVVPHPKPSRYDNSNENRCRVKTGTIASGSTIARHPFHRQNFSRQNDVLAFDLGLDRIIRVLSEESHRFGGLTVVLGITDYRDGSVGQTWQPYAALMAAAVLKTLL